MIKVVVSAVVGGAMVFAGTAATDAAHKNAIPANLRTQFEKFWAEVHKNTPREMANRQPAPVDNVVSTSSRTESATKRALIRLAAAGSDMDFQTSEMTAAVRPLIPAKPDCVLPISTSTEPSALRAKRFEIGDKLKLAFFENVQDVEKNKWGNSAGTGFEQHPELSGEYAVQDDGTVSVPVLGSFDVTSVTPKELQNLMGEEFAKALGRKGFVTIVSIERPPIYVLGPVKTPGSYTYSPGMTVLHAVTLAGGFPREDDTQPWQKIERVRETSKRYSTLESLSELLTREAVLTAERDNTQPVAPQKLIELVAATRAASMIAVEQDRQRARIEARNARLQAAAEAIKDTQQEVEMLSTKSKSIESMDANIASLRKRADGIEQLYHSGALNNNLLIESRSRVSEAERQRQDVIIQVAQAKERLATLRQDQVKIQADIRAEIDTQLQAIDRQITDANRESATSEGVLGAMQVQYTPLASAISYEIVRQTTRGPVAFAANGMSTLIPGDLVQVSTAADKTDPSTPGQPNSRPVATPVSATACR